MSTDGSSIWIGEGARGALLRIDAASVQVSELPAPFGIRPVATAVGACGVWVAGAGGRLALVDPRDAAPLGPAITVGHSIAALAASAGGVWASDPLDGTVVRVSAR
jgi:streptogramin lyase